MIGRYFIALEISDEARLFAERVQAVLDAPNQRKQAPESLHLTIKFFGEVSLEEIARPVFDALNVTSPLDLGEATVNGFPSITHAAVIVLSCADPTKRIAQLAARAEALSLARGASANVHAFNPHITLARCKSHFDARMTAARFAPRDIGLAKRLVLFQSAGGRYKEIP